MNSQFLRCVSLIAALGFMTTAQAMKIAVTDLTYSETVNQYFRDINYHEQSSIPSQISSTGSQDTYSYIEYGELHKFVGDIRDELIHSGLHVVQAKPYTAANRGSRARCFARIGRWSIEASRWQ